MILSDKTIRHKETSSNVLALEMANQVFYIFIINIISILYIFISYFYNLLMFEFSKDVWVNATVLTTTSLISLPNLAILTESFLANKIEKSKF